MNLTLWIVAGVLAALFLASGVTKLARTGEQPITAVFGPAVVRAIGGLEILAAAGLVLPAALDIAPALRPAAAAGLVLLMAGALVFHLRRRETQGIAVTAALLVLSAVVAVGRA
ncbi:DoxX family protein [Dactylosporangium sp. CA-139066]|uniref:DoxX family protein n=1 Tax=Dactylosporangium sp. CA-139066 TaxID=3239930 RepID=UPI003D905EEC